MIKLITYASHNMTRAGELCISSALKHGANVVKLETMPEPWLIYLCPEVMEKKRGAGYWLWKPEMIYRHLKQMEYGEILVYADAGVEIVEDLRHIVNQMQEPIFLFANNYNHRHWCKKRVYDEMFGQEGNQVQASVIFIRKTQRTLEFVNEWLRYCLIPGYIDDTIDREQDADFQEHRHDQAILTCLAQQCNYKLHYWPAMYNGGQFVYDKTTFSDPYPIIFHHHRKRNHEW